MLRVCSFAYVVGDCHPQPARRFYLEREQMAALAWTDQHGKEAVDLERQAVTLFACEPIRVLWLPCLVGRG